ncbi:MAG TPA: glycoside hydrolase family 9 protein, partial [Thermoanaerobaculia bacterium]|nr:glycoside hydrolase family 9 protein [Thermoanaerobaculia bacterium]
MILLAIAIAVNQVAYPAAAPKLAMITGGAPSFSLTRDGKTVLEAPLSAPQLDANSGDRVQIADFASITEPGNYELRAGDARARIVIAADPYADLLRLTVRAYTGQRCGTAVDIGNGYAHPACHLDSPALGGWHDAG